MEIFLYFLFFLSCMSMRKQGCLGDRATAETIKFMKKGLDDIETVSVLVKCFSKLK